MDEVEKFNPERLAWLPNCVIDEEFFTADEFIVLAHCQPSKSQFNQAMDRMECSLIANAIISNLVDGVLGDDFDEDDDDDDDWEYDFDDD